MTGTERFSALAEGRLPDRVPVLCNLLDQGARELGMTQRQYYSRAGHVAEGQLRMREKYGYDVLWGYFYVGREAEVLGCRKMLWSENGAPNVGHLVIREPEDIERLEIPKDLSAIPAFREQLECIRLLKEAAGGRTPVLSAVTGSVTLPSILMGMDHWMRLLLTGPVSLREELLSKCSDFCTRQVRALREAGADFVAYTNPVASADFLTPRLFRELALPTICRDIEAVGPAGIVYFCGGGRILPTIAPIREATGLDAFYLNPFDDVAEAKRLLAGQGMCIGAINDIRLIDGSPEEIRADVRRIMAAGAPGGNFLFGTLLMPAMIPDDSIRVMIDAAHEFGEYGLVGV
ncbi:MAG TPA: uroporphyrinogen decarboxylase family protein [Candidatus Deferrimicrobiaceae bacterium]|jgi:uroporphyrinogen decarboxylase